MLIPKSIFLLFCVGAILFYASRRDNRWDTIMSLLFTAYLIAIVLFTLVGRNTLSSPREMNLIPGNSLITMYRSPWNNRGRYEFVEILGNMILFFPFGFCLRKYGSRRYLSILLFSLFFSAGIELVQYTMNIGVYELDDILNNSWGALLGANYVVITDRIKREDNWKNGIRSITFRDCFAFWPLLLLCLFALSQFVRYVNNKGWLY